MQVVMQVSGTNINIPAIILTAAVITFVFEPLKNISRSIIDRLFFRQAYDPEKTISGFSEVMTRTIKLDEIGQAVCDLITTTLKIDKLVLYTPTNENNFRPLTQWGYSERLTEEIPPEVLWELGQHKNPGVFESKNVPVLEIEAFLNQLKAELLLPLFFENETVGLMVLGRKLSEQKYDLDDYRILEILGNQTAVALHNAYLFEQVRREKDTVTKLLAHEREIDERKSEFILLASHNLRTPLSIINGYAEKFKSQYALLPPWAVGDLETISGAGKQLTLLAEGLLTAADVDRGSLKLNKAPVDLFEITEKLANEYKKQAMQKGLNLEFKKSSETIPAINIDARRIRLAIENLIDNAIKFTMAGQVTVTVGLVRQNIRIDVADTGEGIPESEVPQLFTTFHQIRKSPLEPVPGMGIGLYIVKLIVKAHGGEVQVNSEIGNGSTFSIILPTGQN